VVQAVAEPHRAGRAGASVGARERLGVVVVSVHKQKLEACPAEQCTSGAEEAALFRVVRQVAEVAEGNECVAALLDGPLDQAAQVARTRGRVTTPCEAVATSGQRFAFSRHATSLASSI
jgi:hypothetical protein